jgi:hypothetical protein
MNSPSGTGRRVAWCLVPFLLFATLNSAGYRYGASDLAFYAPAMLEGSDASLYPRDSDLIRSQAKLTLADDVVGPLMRASGFSLPILLVLLQAVALSLLAFAAGAIGARLYRTGWAIVGLLAALTIRHAISKSGTNTLEGYFHPRQLAFAIGALAVAGFLRGRVIAAIALVAGAGALHPTTGLWFAIWLGVASFVAEPRLRPAIGIAVLAGALAGGWLLTSGPLAGRLITMDQEWLATLASKDYLFPLEWPAAAWLVNLGYIPVILLLYRRRRDAGLADARESGLVAGCLALVIVFAASLPFNAARLALAIQLQPARIFWMLDFLAVVYVVWALAEGTAPTPARARFAATALAILSMVRGSYVMFVEFPERRIVRIDIADDDWGKAMAWARGTDVRSGWLADPEHAVRYGSSVRVAGHRDVFVEAIKDGAVGMYDRQVAMRTRDRVQAVGNFTELTAERAARLGQEYDLDFLVTEQTLGLPVAFRSGRIVVYRLRDVR